jgi:DNA-directed RNA polymerase subunit RPC12/RpoP
MPRKITIMKCPNCSNKINLMSIRNDMSCPHCNARIKTKNGMLALIVAALFWSAIFSPVVTMMFTEKHVAMVIDSTVGGLLSYLIFRSIFKLEKMEG